MGSEGVAHLREVAMKIGLELEYLLTDMDGRMANRADAVLAHPLNDGSIVRESSHAVVELNTPPVETLAELDRVTRDGIGRLDRMAAATGLRAVPVSALGPEAPERRLGGKYGLNTMLLGDRAATYAATLGLHINLDRRPEAAAQYNLLQALDPALAFLSATPFLGGRNTMNDRRVYDQRYTVFAGAPLHGQLTGYISDTTALDVLDEQRLAQWTAGLGPEDAAHYSLSTTNWGPLRLHDNKIEARNSDVNLHSLTMAQAALLRGVDHYVFAHGLDVRPAAQYGLTPEAFLVPDFPTLRLLEREAIHHGIAGPHVHSYLSTLVDIAEEGTPDDERQYLLPLRTMLAYRTNLSDVLHTLHSATELPVTAAAKLNRTMAEWAQADLADAALTRELIEGVASEGAHYFIPN